MTDTLKLFRSICCYVQLNKKIQAIFLYVNFSFVNYASLVTRFVLQNLSTRILSIMHS